MNAIEGHISDGLAPYARKDFGNYSLKQMADAVKSDDPHKQAKFLAASALQPELQAMRLGVLNAPVGQRMINGMIEKSHSVGDTLRQTLTPETYSLMQKYMNDWINEAAEVAQQSQLAYKPREEGEETNRNAVISTDKWEVVSQ
jgi:hypothetical protein